MIYFILLLALIAIFSYKKADSSPSGLAAYTLSVSSIGFIFAVVLPILFILWVI